jgi:hypothetical protein
MLANARFLSAVSTIVRNDMKETCSLFLSTIQHEVLGTYFCVFKSAETIVLVGREYVVDREQSGLKKMRHPPGAPTFYYNLTGCDAVFSGRKSPAFR